MKEYQVENVASTPSTLEQVLNNYAKDGWSVTTVLNIDGSPMVKVVLEREKPVEFKVEAKDSIDIDKIINGIVTVNEARRKWMK